MKRLIYSLVSCLVLFLWIPEFHLFGEEKTETFDRGVIIERVVCRDEPEQSYALYLPESYSKDKKWPVLYAQDPGGVGKRPLIHYQNAARIYGYIVVGLNNSRNGPWEPILKSIHTVWHDTLARFSIDEKRVYTTGFSGGARAASAFPLEIQKPVAGTIACGAGLPPWMKPEQLKTSFFYAIVGRSDFNYRELTALDETLDRQGIPHRIEVIEGGHRWPPEADCTRAVEWLEIQAMIKGFRSKDRALIERIYGKFMQKAAALEKAGDLLSAVETYESVSALFNDLRDVAETREKIQKLKEGGRYQVLLDEEKARMKRELERIGEFQSVFADIEHPEGDKADLEKVFAALHIEALLTTSRDETAPQDRTMARRLLYDLGVHAEEKGLACLKKGDSGRAVIFYEIAVKARDADPYLFYNLACAYAVDEKSEKAIHYFRRAVDGGFRDPSFFENDKDLDHIRDEEAFQDILNRLKKGEAKD